MLETRIYYTKLKKKKNILHFLRQMVFVFFRAPIDEGNDKSLVIDEALTISDGLAIDWIYYHIYWTDARGKNIKLADFDGNMKKTLITDNIQEPRALAVNPLEGWMFWTDWGETARIEKSGMDGSHRSVSQPT